MAEARASRKAARRHQAMKRIVSGLALAFTMTFALGSAGCAHRQLTNQQVAKTAVVVGGIILLIAAPLLCTQYCKAQD